ERHAVIVSIKAKHSNLVIAKSLIVPDSSVCKVRKELLNENNGARATMGSRGRDKGIVNAPLLTHSQHLSL
ncbi:unnamed protein product, partial [Hymenolepis diminuta]